MSSSFSALANHYCSSTGIDCARNSTDALNVPCDPAAAATSSAAASSPSRQSCWSRAEEETLPFPLSPVADDRARQDFPAPNSRPSPIGIVRRWPPQVGSTATQESQLALPGRYPKPTQYLAGFAVAHESLTSSSQADAAVAEENLARQRAASTSRSTSGDSSTSDSLCMSALDIGSPPPTTSLLSTSLAKSSLKSQTVTRPLDAAPTAGQQMHLPALTRRLSIPATLNLTSSPSAVKSTDLRRHASIGNKPSAAREFLCRHDSVSSMVSATGSVSASSFSSLPPSPAVSFLSNIAECTAQPLKRCPTTHGWQGEVVGDYTIGKKIGVGNFAEVYDACVTNDMMNSTHLVAVKIVAKNRPADSPVNDQDDAEAASKAFQARLAREINIWRQLKHPNLVRLFEVAHTADHCFLFSEYCKNSHLLAYMDQSGSDGLTEPICGFLFRQAADALLYLHEEVRVVHRDIKPENILLTTDFEGHLVVKLCDFGLSEYFFSNGNGQQSNSNNINNSRHSPSPTHSPPLASYACAGSLAYCAPEEISSGRQQADNGGGGEPFHPSPLADVWSMGVVLYAMLTGRLPFADDYMPRLQLRILAGKYSPLPTMTTPLSAHPAGSTSPFPFTSAAWSSAAGSSYASNFSNYSGADTASSPAGCSPTGSRVYSDDVADLVDHMLKVDVKERFCIRQVREHAWLQSTRLDMAAGVVDPFG